MPKVSEEHKQRRREEILDGAQRAFARHGYEGATVARIEEETGLSRGAIFNYFENKEALFVSLVARSSDRFVEIWLEQGYRALLEAVTHADRRLALGAGGGEPAGSAPTRASESRSRKLDESVEETRAERYARLSTSVRDDMPVAVVAQFLGLIANGLAFARVTDDPMPDLDDLMTLIETGVAPR